MNLQLYCINVPVNEAALLAFFLFEKADTANLNNDVFGLIMCPVYFKNKQGY